MFSFIVFFLFLFSTVFSFPTFLPTQPLTSFNSTFLTNWIECLTFNQNINGPTLDQIYSLCSGPNLMIGCRAPNSPIYNVVSGAPKNFTNSSLANYANTTWSFNSMRWTAVNASISPAFNCLFASGTDTICWNTNGTTIRPGGWCGTVGYDSSASVQRVVLSDPCGGSAVAGTACTTNQYMCSQNNTCQINGTCGGGSLIPVPVSTQCTTYTCNRFTGNIDITYAPADSFCNGNDTCFMLYGCDGAGQCVSNTSTICPLAPQCQVNNGCYNSTCLYNNTLPGSFCSDGNFCTDGDACSGTGVCNPGSPKNCTSIGPCYGIGTCNPVDPSGLCTNPVLADTTPCVNDNQCAETSQCFNATCTGLTFKTCPPIGDCYVAGLCLQAFGNCTTPFKAVGSTCNSSSCFQNMQCNGFGSCNLGTPILNCNRTDQCHLQGTRYPFNSSLCLCTNPLANDSIPCDTGDVCTNGTCLIGSCVPGVPMSCPGDQCNDPTTCDSVNGCLNPKPDGTPCSTGNVCFVNQFCTTGVCGGGDIVSSIPACNSGHLFEWFMKGLL
jgi:hypothetical protein